MSKEYIVVQAGGKGSRLKELTRNKPKCLVPVNNLPILFHLFKKFPNAHFVIIGDYKYDVLERYLYAFSTVEYDLVNAKGKKGTCGGLKEALEFIPEDTAFLLIWSDLVLPDSFSLSAIMGGNFVGLSEDFPCRWRYKDGAFEEISSEKEGVAGLFSFCEKSIFKDLPNEGEFVRWLSCHDEIHFNTVGLSKAKEYGLKEDYDKLKVEKCRPFNSMEVMEDTIIKKPIDKQGEQLAEKEIGWYRYVEQHNYQGIPKIYSYDPLTMEKIDGKNLYEYNDLSYEKKKEILSRLVAQLKELHQFGSCEFDRQSYDNAYIEKTLDRLEKVKNLVPFANDEVITINGRKCRNFFYHIDEVRNLFQEYKPDQFVFIHGDCTFSNMMLRFDKEPVLIDPRGYFGKTLLYGDPAYDWAKLYYSIVGNYDQFNLKRFDLEIDNDQVSLQIQSSGWEDTEALFFELIGDEFPVKQIRLIHAIIWLSLTTYAWENYDSICGAFYNGIYYFEDIM